MAFWEDNIYQILQTWKREMREKQWGERGIIQFTKTGELFHHLKENIKTLLCIIVKAM
jgi:hypothetical protein